MRDYFVGLSAVFAQRFPAQTAGTYTSVIAVCPCPGSGAFVLRRRHFAVLLLLAIHHTVVGTTYEYTLPIDHLFTMLTSRVLFRASSVRAVGFARTTVAGLSSKSVPAAKAPEEEEEDTVPAVTKMRQEMRKSNPHQVMGPVGESWAPAPVLPEDPKEIAALDPADQRFRTKIDGTERTVIIRQDQAKAGQSPLNPESVWRIAFYEDGIFSEKWTNPLMGWQSTSDPYVSAPPLIFSNAADAVYFAKKRGWNYIVKEPIKRTLRDDDAQYQDNFLPQAIAKKVQMEGTTCDHWKRTSAGTSHYFRPLKYHGDGTVAQHGPNGNEDIAPHTEGYYKMR
jgi:hypothetical protein